MDISRLCPGCMREVEEMRTGGTQGISAKGTSTGNVPTNREIGEQNTEARIPGKCPYCGFRAAAYRQNSRCLPIHTILAGKYLVGAVLGEGGFGITYMGYDLNMETRIAIKEYFPVELVSRDTTSMTGDRVISMGGDKSVTYKQGLKKYVAEARNVSQFSETPGVVSVKDFFYGNETAYIVMEYIDGISLKDYLKERGGRLSEEESLAIMKPVLEALVKVHESGIIHRDISSDNIMLTFSGERITSVKLIDFGAARMTAKDDQKSLTIILKHGYAPEEQYRTHGEQGPWTDVYAVCAVLYRMLTGETPVPAMDRLFQDSLKPFADLNAQVSRNIEMAILKGLAVKKEDRIQSVRELIQALYAGKPVKGMRKRTLTSWVAGAACLAVMMILAGSLILVRNHLRKEPVSDTEQLQGTESAENEKAEGMKETGTAVTESESGESGSRSEETIIFEEEKLGETIAYPNPQTSISAGEGFVLFRMPDGTVQARGKNESGQCMVGEWHDIVAVSAGTGHSLGLQSDGKVVAAGDNSNGQCEVENWENVVQIEAGSLYSFGLTTEGKVLFCGGNIYGVESIAEVMEWEDIIAIATGGTNIVGLDREGYIHSVGEGVFSASGWGDVRHLYYLKGGDVGILMGIKEDGGVVRTIQKDADRDPGQMGEFSEKMEGWSDIQQLDKWRGVRKDGTVISDLWRGERMQGTLAQWTDMEGVVDSWNYVFGLRKDGEILEYFFDNGPNSITLESLMHQEKLDWIYVIRHDGMDFGLVAGTKTGEILYYGVDDERAVGYYLLKEKIDELSGQVCGIELNNGAGTALSLLMADGAAYWLQISSPLGGYIEEWNYGAEDAKQLLPFYQWAHSGVVILKRNGQIQVKLSLSDDAKEYYEKRYAGLKWDWIEMVEEWTDVVQVTGDWSDLSYSENGIVDFYGLHSDGTISTTNPDRQEEIAAYSGISRLVQRGHDILAIREDGTAEIIAASEYAVIFGRTQVTGWSDLQDIAMGGSHVVGLRKDGTVVAAGSNHEGQCDVEDWTDRLSDYRRKLYPGNHQRREPEDGRASVLRQGRLVPGCITGECRCAVTCIVESVL